MADAVQTLGRYRLQRKIGTGAMGLVYEAVDPKLNRSVAIKTILKSHLGEDVAREYSVRFREEAQAAARLNHPNIVQVYDFGEEGDVAFIVMELIRGKDLKQCFDAKVDFPPKEFVRLMCELLSALDYAHQARIVHRDIKPGNIMFDVQSRVKLMDFGVARMTDSERTHRTQLGTMVGTPAYMSPEQVQGLWVDHRSDLFSCGIVLYQFLTNQRPFTGGDWTLRKMIVHEDPPRPSQLNAAISPEYDKVIGRALAKAPEARYQSAIEFSRALRRVLEGKPAEDEGDGTVMMRPAEPVARAPAPKAAPAKPAPSPTAAPSAPTPASQEVEVEFWRSIKDSDDPEDYELYLQQFPQGAYARLAERKIAKLRRSAAGTGSGIGGASVTATNTSTTAAEAEAKRIREEEDRRLAGEQALREAEARRQLEKEAEERRSAEERARQEAEARAKREAMEKLRREAEERARLEAERVRRQNEEKAPREAEARAKREAEEKARRESEERARLEQERARLEAEAKAKREAEEKARREAEERARLAAEAKAKREAEAKAEREAEERARREAEERARLERERAQQDAEAKAKREAEEKARREVEDRARLERARQEAEAKAKREAEEKARREAAERARKEAEERARRALEQKAKETVDETIVDRRGARLDDEMQDFTVAPVRKAPNRMPLVLSGVAAALIGGGTAAYFLLKSSPQSPAIVTQEPPQVAKVAPQAPAVSRAPAAERAAPAQEPAVDESAKREAQEAEERARREQLEAQQREKAKLADEQKKREAARLAEEAKKREALAKADEERKRLGAEGAKKREALAKAEEEKKRLAAEEARKREAAKAEEEKKRAAEEARRREAIAKAEQERKPKAPEEAKPRLDTADLFRRAGELESHGKVAEAVKLYTAAANANHGASAKKLGDIFSGGRGDVPADYVQSLRWYQKARVLGESVPMQKGR